MPGISVSKICVPFGGGGIDWSSYWRTLTDKVLFLGEISKISDGKLYNQVSGATDYLTVGGDAGSYTLECPDTADYENADTDSIWFSGGSPATVTEATLIGADYSSTPVKYDSGSPYAIRAIIIFKQGAVLTAAELDRLHKDMLLWIYWTNELNAYGVIKENRTIGSKPIVVSADIMEGAMDDVVITFNQALDETSVPAVSAFALEGKTITSVDVTGTKVTLTVSVAYDYDDAVTVDYTRPAVNPIKAATSDRYTDTFEDQSVVNLRNEVRSFIAGLTADLSSTEIGLLNTFVNSVKSGMSLTDLGDGFDCLWINSGETREASLRNLVKNAHHINAVNSPTWVQHEGFTGNGTTQHLNPNYNANDDGVAYTLNSASFGLYTRTNASVAGARAMGARVAHGDDMSILIVNSGGGTYFYINQDSTTGITYLTDSDGMHVVSRTGANAVAYYRNKTARATNTESSQAIPDLDMYLMCMNDNGSPVFRDTRQFSMFFFGRGLSQADVNVLTDAFEAYMDAKGKGVIA